MKRTFIKAIPFVILAGFFLLISFTSASAQTTEVQFSPTPSQERSLLQPQTSLGKSLLAEQKAQQQLQEQLRRVSQLQKSLNNEINAYRIQISSHNNLLLIPNIPVKDLQSAQKNLLTSSGHIAVQLKGLIQERNGLKQIRLDAQKQYRINEEQIAEIQAEIEENASTDRATETLLSELRQLNLLLSMKQQLIETIYSRYGGQIHNLEEIRQDSEQLATNFELKIAERKKQNLFTRKMVIHSALRYIGIMGNIIHASMLETFILKLLHGGIDNSRFF